MASHRIFTPSSRHRTGDTWPDGFIMCGSKLTLPKVWGEREWELKDWFHYYSDGEKSDTAWTKSQSKIERKKLTDDWKRRTDKNRRNEECRQTGSRDWSSWALRSNLGHRNIRQTWHHRQHTLAAVNSDKSNTFLMMKIMSEEDQVQTTTSNTNNNHKSFQISLQFRQETHFNHILYVAVTQH